MLRCFHFLVEPAKNVTLKLKESRKKAKSDKREPLEESQLFMAELARDLNRVCKRSEVLEHIWKWDDIWATPACQAFILEWASVLQSKSGSVQTDSSKPDRAEESERDLTSAKKRIRDWSKELRALPEQSVWPGEAVVLMLTDLEAHWKKGRMPNLQTAMELVMWAVLTKKLDQEALPQQWLTWKQRSQKIGAVHYIPQTVWDWITDAGVDVTLDQDTANPDLLISDEKRMRCGLERSDVPNYHGRFDGWWCAIALEGFASGRHYWEVEVGERDWRLGVAKESALRKGFKSLNTTTGYLSLRLERGSELKALTVPFTALPAGLIPRRVGVHLDYEAGQLSFYDVERRAHIYTYSETFAERLFPLFGTVEIASDLVIQTPGVKAQCLCPSVCMWA